MRESSNPTVLLLAPLPPPLGGMASWTEGLLRSRVGHQFRLLVLRPDLLPKHGFRGIARVGIAALNSILVAMSLVVRLIRSRPRIVHVATNSYVGFYEKALLTLMARLWGSKTIIHVHGGAFGEFYRDSSAPFRWLIRRSLAFANVVVAVSEAAGRYLLEMAVPAERLIVWPNSVEIPEVDIEPRERDGPLTVLFLNRIDQAKGIGELVDAAAELSKSRRDVRFRIVGPDSPTRRAVRERVLEERLTEFVSVDEELTGAEKDRAYRGADIYVLPSHVEGMPIGLLEAMAYGLACVTTPVGGIPEVVTEGVDGLIVPVGDASALARAIESLAASPALRRGLGDAARRTAINRFSWDARAAQVAMTYWSLLEGRPAGAVAPHANGERR